MTEDANLLRRYAAEHAEDAFAEIVRRHLDAVYSGALRRVGGDIHLAQDVTQQVFVALARKAAAVSHHPVLSGWLHVATRNEAASLVRRERRRRVREQEAHAMTEILSENRTEADWSRVAPVLDAALDELDDRDRVAILLRFVERRTFPEMGRQLRLTDDAARMRVDRALDKLRQLLGRRGIDSTSAALGLALANHAVTAAPVGLAATVVGTSIAVAPGAMLSLASVVELMGTTKAAASVVGILLIGGALTVTREVVAVQPTAAVYYERRSAYDASAAQLLSLRQRLTAATREAVELQRQVDAAQAARRAATQPRSASGRPAATPVNPPTQGRDSPQALAAGNAFMDRHPEVKQALLELYRANLAEMYGDFYRARNFTSAQREQFETFMLMDLTSLRQVPGPDGRQMALAGPDSGNREKRREFEKQLGWLGMDGWQRLRRCLEQQPARRAMSEFARALYLTPTPLTPSQFEQVSSILSSARPSQGVIPWDAILPDAARVLSESQFGFLKGIADQDRFRLALNEAVRNTPPAVMPAGNSPR